MKCSEYLDKIREANIDYNDAEYLKFYNEIREINPYNGDNLKPAVKAFLVHSKIYAMNNGHVDDFKHAVGDTIYCRSEFYCTHREHYFQEFFIESIFLDTRGYYEMYSDNNEVVLKSIKNWLECFNEIRYGYDIFHILNEDCKILKELALALLESDERYEKIRKKHAFKLAI